MSFRALWRGSLENPYTYLLLLFFAYTIFKRLWCWCMYPRVFIYLLSTQEQQKDRKKLRRCACVRVGEWIKEISLNIHFTKTCQVRASGCDGNEALQIKCTSWETLKEADQTELIAAMIQSRFYAWLAGGSGRLLMSKLGAAGWQTSQR